jgi:hypothetical protein
LQARELNDRVILAHISALLSAPTGPLAGETNAFASIVLVGDGDERRIAAFHNTVVASRESVEPMRWRAPARGGRWS